MLRNLKQFHSRVIHNFVKEMGMELGLKVMRVDYLAGKDYSSAKHRGGMKKAHQGTIETQERGSVIK